MRVLKLALRVAMHHRRSLGPALFALVAAGFVVTVAGSSLAPLRDRLGADFAWMQSLAAEAGVVVRDSGVLETVMLIRPPGAARAGAGADASTETAGAEGSAGQAAETDGSVAAADLDRLVSLLSGGQAPRTGAAALPSITDHGSGEPVLLLRAGESDSRQVFLSSADAETETVVVIDATVDARPAENPQSRTGVTNLAAPAREVAERTSGRLRRAELLLFVVLAVLSLTALVPGMLLVVRGMEADLALLEAWGFRQRTRSALVLLVAGFAAIGAAVVGGGAGLILCSVLNAASRASVSLLPPGLLGVDGRDLVATLAAGSAQVAVVTPAIGYFVATLAGSTLLAVVAALPSLRFAATLSLRRIVWQW